LGPIDENAKKTHWRTEVTFVHTSYGQQLHVGLSTKIELQLQLFQILCWVLCQAGYIIDFATHFLVFFAIIILSEMHNFIGKSEPL